MIVVQAAACDHDGVAMLYTMRNSSLTAAEQVGPLGAAGRGAGHGGGRTRASHRSPLHLRGQGGHRLPRRPWYLSQISSLDRRHLLKHHRDDPRFRRYLIALNLTLTELVVEVSVPCKTPETILRDAGVRPDELLALTIDTEGYDAQLVLSLNLTQAMRPWLLIFEHCHTTPARKRLAVAHLQRQGYACIVRDVENIFCVRRAGSQSAPWMPTIVGGGSNSQQQENSVVCTNRLQS